MKSFDNLSKQIKTNSKKNWERKFNERRSWKTWAHWSISHGGRSVYYGASFQSAFVVLKIGTNEVVSLEAGSGEIQIQRNSNRMDWLESGSFAAN